MKRLAVFDLDGTLNQTMLYAVEAHRLALNKMGVFHLTDEEITSHFGSRPEDYVKEMLPNHSEEDHALYHKHVGKNEHELMIKHGKAFDGVKESLIALRKDGVIIAVCSNSSNRYITAVLKAIGLYELVDHIQQLLPNMIKDDTLKILLDEVKADKACMVGDRIYDKNAAIVNKIPFVGCAYGYNASEVEKSDYTVYTADELYNAVITLIGE